MSGPVKKTAVGAEGPVTPNEELMSILVNMGVTNENAAKALEKTGNVSAEVAARWIYENRESFRPSTILRTPSLGLNDVDSPKGHRMVLVVNVGLNLSNRKLAIQVAHASLGVYRAMMIEEERFGKMLLRWEECGGGWTDACIVLTDDTVATGEISYKEKVVVLQETGSHALMELARQANLMGLPHFLVDDTNKTQATPGSVTVLGMLGTTEKVDKVVGSLQPL